MGKSLLSNKIKKWSQREPQRSTRVPPVTACTNHSTVSEETNSRLINQGIADMQWLKQKQAELGMATTAIVQDQGCTNFLATALHFDFLEMKTFRTLNGTVGVGEIKKIETEMWNLKVDKIEKYIGGLPDMILGSVKASKPKTMQEAIEFTTDLMDDKSPCL
ncbi:hypothetical protein Tco_1024399 [Tanacetum coccineum]